MKKLFLMLLIVNFVGAFSPMDLSQKPQIEDSARSIYIYQNEELINEERGIYYLKRSEFDLVFNLVNIKNSFLVNFSTDETSYKQALSGANSKDILAYYHTGMAEGLFNEDFRVILRDNASHAFFYDDENNHRFNKVEKNGNIYSLTRTVQKIYDFESKVEKDISLIDFDYLYIVSLEYEFDREKFERVDKDIEVIKIKFVD